MREVGFSRSINGSLSHWTPVKEIFGFEDLPTCVDVYNNAAVKAANAYFMVPSEYLLRGICMASTSFNLACFWTYE